MNNKDVDAQEWSYNFISDEVDEVPVKVKLSAPKECLPLLCKRLDLQSIESLDADIVITRNIVNKVIHIEGTIKANIHQKCVISGEPVSEVINEKFESWFSEPSNAVSFTKAKRERTISRNEDEHPMLDECEDPEEVIDGKIDLGELVTQYLSLSLNHYPKIEGAEFNNEDNPLSNNEDDKIYDNPFAALKAWKVDEKKKDK